MSTELPLLGSLQGCGLWTQESPLEPHNVDNGAVEHLSADRTGDNSSAAGEEMPYRAAEHVRVSTTMEKAAAARRDIYELWRTTSDRELNCSENYATPTEGGTDDADRMRIDEVARILKTYCIGASVQRDEDICRGLGDALDRLLLLCLPFSSALGTEQLEQVLHAAARQGRQLSVRTVQHIFARTSNYAEALAVFYALRRCHFAMNMETYHAMLYSLQRLEEEGWALRFHGEYALNNGAKLSEQALDFVLRGIDNQLIPESKPWLGRIMFAEPNNAAAQRQTRQSFDKLGELWVDRYMGSRAPKA